MADDERDHPLLRGLLIAFLAFVTLGAGAAGLCGAVFTLTTLFQKNDGYNIVIYVIAVPSLLIGGVIAWQCGRALWRRLRPPRD